MTSLPVERLRCICGHARGAHDHYRPGKDCGVCGPGSCPAWQPACRGINGCADGCRADVTDFDHHCQVADDLEADLAVARNLALFAPFRVSRVGKFEPQRAKHLWDLHQRFAWRTAALAKAAGQAPSLIKTPAVCPPPPSRSPASHARRRCGFRGRA